MQVILLRKAGHTYDAMAAQTGLRSDDVRGRSMRWKVFAGALNADVLIAFLRRLTKGAGAHQGAADQGCRQSSAWHAAATSLCASLFPS